MKGSTNHKTNRILDHATSNQHEAAMVRYQCDYASPVAQHLLRIDPTTYAYIYTRARMNKKFNVCYLLAKEGVAFKP